MMTQIIMILKQGLSGEGDQRTMERYVFRCVVPRDQGSPAFGGERQIWR